MKQLLFTNWHFMRWLRLGLAIYLAIQGIVDHDPLFGFISVFFLFQAVTNTGCCGTNNCAVQLRKNDKDKSNEISFEEVNTK